TAQLGAPYGVNLMANTSVLGAAVPLTPFTVAFGPAVAFLVLLTLGTAGTAYAWYHAYAVPRGLAGGRGRRRGVLRLRSRAGVPGPHGAERLLRLGTVPAGGAAGALVATGGPAGRTARRADRRVRRAVARPGRRGPAAQFGGTGAVAGAVEAAAVRLGGTDPARARGHRAGRGAARDRARPLPG